MGADSAEKTRALEQCERDLDLAIERLLNLRLDPAPDGEGAAASDGDVVLQVHVAAAAAEVAVQSVLPVPSGGGGGGSRAEWAALLFDRMNSAADADDARARAAGLLEAFEGSLAAASRAELDVAVWQNGILKKAVVLQHRLRKEQEEANRRLEHQVAGCQERLRKIETDNYTLSMHLRQAQQQGNPTLGRFHPEVF